MIVEMARVRILGERERLEPTIRALQDLGVLHLAEPAPRHGVAPIPPDTRAERRRRHLLAVLDDVETALAALEVGEGAVPAGPPAGTEAEWARRARRTRRLVERLRARAAGLDEENALLARYRELFAAFEDLLESGVDLRDTIAHYLVLRPRQEEVVERLRAALAETVGAGVELRARALPGGETALLVAVPVAAAAEAETIFGGAGVEEVRVPAAYGASLVDALPRMLRRMEALPRELDAARKALREAARAEGPGLLRLRAALHDRLRALEGRTLAAATARAFVLEGWAPAEVLPRLRAHLDRAVGEAVVVELVSREEWKGEDAPVVLRNPRLFRPFEALIALMPLPRYGSIDPTPFVAVFFPMFFGLILGDVGYGAALALLAFLLHRGAAAGSLRQQVAEIAGACAAFSLTFGLLFGELLGDAGRRWLGMRPLAFDREEAIVPFLVLAVSIGFVHVLLGLGLGVVQAFHENRREAVGRGATAAMVVLVTLALLAAVEVIPKTFFTPLVVALLVAFPVLVVAEGILGPVELLSAFAHVLSYARIMALGSASVMMAVVANRMMGAFGSALVGALFALLFHLVNFGLGLFSPTIHSLRLHYVEFFGNFYSPGGVRYRPLGHWTPSLHGKG